MFIIIFWKNLYGNFQSLLEKFMWKFSVIVGKILIFFSVIVGKF